MTTYLNLGKSGSKKTSGSHHSSGHCCGSKQTTKNLKKSCLDEKQVKKNMEKYFTKNGLTKGKPKNSNYVEYLDLNYLDSLNIYLRSVLQDSYINLSAFDRTFKVFFPTKNTPEIDKVDLAVLGKVVGILPWKPINKPLILQAFKQYGDYLGNVKFVEVPTYQEANLVVCNIDPNNGIIGYGSSTLPYYLDTYESVLNGKSFQWYNGDLNEKNNWEKGTFAFEAVLHETGHNFGLKHPFEAPHNMPGTSFETATFNQGLFFANNTITTVMSFFDTVPMSDTATNFVRTLSSLDLQGLRVLYGPQGASNNSDYIENTLDLTLPLGISQTLVSTETGLTVTLSPKNENENIFNLNLEPFNANSTSNFISAYALVSGSSLGNDLFNGDASLISYHLIDALSYISKVITSYPELNVFSNNIYDSCEIVINSPNVKIIKIWLNCSNSIIKTFTSGNQTTITNTKNSKSIRITNTRSDVEISVECSIPSIS